MTFLLDNYDSFTYNLAQYLGELGEKVVVRRNDQLTLAELERMKPKRIVISPGPGTRGIVADSHPEREYHETVNKSRALLASIELRREV